MLSVAELKRILSYNRRTGLFRWKYTRGWRAEKGAIAGRVHQHGYIHIHVGKKIYKGHRLAWAFVTGAFPDHDVEHRDLDKTNNRWANLREANDSLNQANTRLRFTSTSGLKGVHFRKDNKRWRARIMVRGKRIALGDFSNKRAAGAAYAKAAKKHFGEFARTA